jgi:hypothetical protein
MYKSDFDKTVWEVASEVMDHDSRLNNGTVIVRDVPRVGEGKWVNKSPYIVCHDSINIWMCHSG